MKTNPVLWLLLCWIAAGCATRSISNSDYHGSGLYQGELSELEVLGVASGTTPAEEAIQQALNQPSRIHLQGGATLVLVQSGVQFPDEALLKEANRNWRVIPLSGVPARNPAGTERRPLDKALRLAAAQASAETLMVCWGILESGTRSEATKTISWVPIVGRLLPDETQVMRIRLKAVVIDVRSGHWEMLLPEVYEDQRLSAKLDRAQSDQGQVQRLKSRAYARLIEDLLQKFP